MINVTTMKDVPVVIRTVALAASLMAGSSLAATSDVGAPPTGPAVAIVEFTEAGQRKGVVMVEKVIKTEEEWQKQLTSEQFHVTREKGTERAYSGKLWDNHEAGIYKCVCCGTTLFSSDTKFESGTGWPSFYQPIAEENVGTETDTKFFMRRTEVHCKRCDAHLGHVFDDGPKPTGLRYCINSASLTFTRKQ